MRTAIEVDVDAVIEIAKSRENPVGWGECLIDATADEVARLALERERSSLASSGSGRDQMQKKRRPGDNKSFNGQHIDLLPGHFMRRQTRADFAG